MSEQNNNVNSEDYYHILLDKILNDKNFLKELSSKEDLHSMYEYSKSVVGEYPEEIFFKVIQEIKAIPISDSSLEKVNGGNFIGKVLDNIQQFLDNGGNLLIKVLSKF